MNSETARIIANEIRAEVRKIPATENAFEAKMVGNAIANAFQNVASKLREAEPDRKPKEGV